MQNTAEIHLKYAPEITWPKDFPELKLIDDALRCGICYDYIKTCMVTPCAHSYCSICIRRSLLYKTACPTCFEETFETSLRNNRVLDRVTELFSSIKERLVKHLKIAAVHFNCNEQVLSPATSQTLLKSNIHDSTPKRNVQKPPKPTSSKGKLQFTTKSQSISSKFNGRSDISKRLEDILSPPTTKSSLTSEVNCVEPSRENESMRVSSVPPMFLQPKVDNQPKLLDEPVVPCPVCGVNIPERNINIHLDTCLTNADKPPIKKSPIKARKKRNPLPKMVWSLMAEKDLRKKLKDYGLNTQGDKKALISRIQRYILLFNSECDSDNPRPISEIIRQLEREEKQTPAQSHQRLFINNKSDPKIVEEENKKYIEENKNSFKKLIEAMKEREGKYIKPLSHSSHRILSDDEDNATSTNNFKEVEHGKPSTSKSIDLCDSVGSDLNRSMSSPILGASNIANKEICNGYDSDTSVSDLTPNNSLVKDTNSTKINETQSRNLEELCSMLSSSDVDLSNDNSPSKKSRHSSPRIVSVCNSDSEDSFSILTKDNSEDDFFENSTEVLTECLPNINSQLEDPDFVVDPDQTENTSDEVFIPQRRSKRKFQNTVKADTKQNPSPRRTRRRLIK